MGTETFFLILMYRQMYSPLMVKLNNPLMGTETIQRIQQFQNSDSNLLN